MATEQEPAGKPTPPENPYDHSETDFDPELDGVPAPSVSAKPAAKPTPSSPAAVPSSPPPKPRKHPSGLRRRALELGATIEQIDGTTTTELDEWVYDQNRLLEVERERAQMERSTHNVVEAKRRQANAEPVEPEDELGLGDLEKDLDPRFSGLLKRLAKENKELKEAVTTSTQREQQRQQRATYEVYDSAFESMGPRYEKIFGKGDGSELKGTKELQRRLAVLASAQIDVANDSPNAMKRKIAKAVDALYGDLAPGADTGRGGDEGVYGGSGLPTNGLAADVPRKSNGKPRITQEEWDEGTLAKTTQRTSKEPRGVGRATRAVAEKMRELGVTDDDFAFEEDGLPE